MATPNISALTAQLEALKGTDLPQGQSRKQLYNAARDLCFSLEDPQDPINRIAYSVSEDHILSNKVC